MPARNDVLFFLTRCSVAGVNQDQSLWQTVRGLGYLLEMANTIALGYICRRVGQDLHDFSFVVDY